MPLKIYYNSGTKRISFAISLKELELFEPAFITLEKKTGNFIDPYGKSIIPPAHQAIILEFLSNQKNSRLNELKAFLSDTYNKDETVYSDGF
jgi:hypothetical protein